MRFRGSILATLALAAVTMTASTSPARGAVVHFSGFGWDAETPDGVDLTALSNDPGTLILALEKTAQFLPPASPGGTVAPLAITFTQTSPSAVPDIAIVDEVVTNDTGSDWTGFTFSIAGGLSGGAATPSFDAASASLFLTAPFNDRSLSTDARQLAVTGGIVPAGPFPANLYRPGDTTGGTTQPLIIHAEPTPAGNQSFDFVEQPTAVASAPVPSPSSASTLMLLLGLGLTCFPRYTRHRAGR